MRIVAVVVAALVLGVLQVPVTDAANRRPYVIGHDARFDAFSNKLWREAGGDRRARELSPGFGSSNPNDRAYFVWLDCKPGRQTVRLSRALTLVGRPSFLAIDATAATSQSLTNFEVFVEGTRVFHSKLDPPETILPAAARRLFHPGHNDIEFSATKVPASRTSRSPGVLLTLWACQSSTGASNGETPRGLSPVRDAG